MSHVFEDTLTANAMYYLSSCSEITREEFLAEHAEGWRCHMLYVGGGYVPLTVAVATANHRDFYGADWSGAASMFEEWARNNGRLDEIGEDNPDDEYFGEYELRIEDIPEEIKLTEEV